MSNLELLSDLLKGVDLTDSQILELLKAAKNWRPEILQKVCEDNFSYSELHVHTEYSLLDGVNKLSDYIKRAAELGHPALANTDHRVTHGWFKMRTAKDMGVEPVFGCEVEVLNEIYNDSEHLVLLAENNVGYQNILRIVAWSHLEGFYKKATVTREIVERYSEGVIALSACIGGVLGKPLARIEKHKIKERKATINLGIKNIDKTNLKISSIQEEIEVLSKEELTDEISQKITELEATIVKLEEEILVCESEIEIAKQSSILVTKEEADELADEIEKSALYWNKVFDKFYLEVQDYTVEDSSLLEERELSFLNSQGFLNEMLYNLTTKLNIPLIATSDIHYVMKEHAEVQDLLLCVSSKKTINDPTRFKFPSKLHYMKSKWEMLYRFRNHPEAVLNTEEIVSSCSIQYQESYLLPSHPHLPVGMTQEAFFRERTLEGLHAFYDLPENYMPLLVKFNCTKEELWDRIVKRAEYEMGVLLKMGFEGYILVVSRCVEIPKEKGYLVGHGRGSAAGSIVALANGITDVCPLRFDLLFERFLNPDRIEMPDIDIDYQYEYRAEVIKQVADEIGHDKVAQIVTYGKMAAKSAIRNMGKAMDLPLSLVDKVAKAVPFGSNLTKALQDENFLKVYNSSPITKKLVDFACMVEGKPKNYSVHAAGVILSSEPLTDHVSLQTGKKAMLPVIQAEMGDVDGLRLVKQDFLGLRNLTIIAACIKLVKERTGKDIDPYKIPRDDKATFEMLSRGESIACFQLESAGMRQLLRDMQINCIEDIVDCIALYRPGVLSVGMHNEYVKNKYNPSAISYIHDALIPLLSSSRGIMIYQEQAMFIAHDVAGFSMAKADKLRKAIGKKKEDIMAALKVEFIKGCWNVSKIDETTASEIWHLIEVMASYSFNKSHSVGYAFTSNDTAYLKCHYPIEYMACAIQVAADGKSPKVPLYIQEAMRMGIEVSIPDINLAQDIFSIQEDKIVFGLRAIRDVGKAVEEILEERNKNGAFKSVIDFRKRCPNVNKKALTALVTAGCFDSLGINRNSIIAMLPEILKIKPKKPTKTQIKKAMVDGILPPDFNSIPIFKEVVVEFPTVEDVSKEELSNIEINYFGTYIANHPLSAHKEVFDTQIQYTAEELEGDIAEGQVVVMGGLVKTLKKVKTKAKQEDMAIFELDDMTGTIDAVMFPRQYASIKDLEISEGSIVLIKGKTQFKEKFNFGSNEEGENEEEQQREYDIQIIIDSLIIFNPHSQNTLKVSVQFSNPNTPKKQTANNQSVPQTDNLKPIPNGVLNLQQYLSNLGYPTVVSL